MVKASASRAAHLGLNRALATGTFSRLNQASDLKLGIAVATQLGAWSYRVSVGTGSSAVSVLKPGGIESLICSFCPSVAADASLRYACMLRGH